MIPHYIGGYKQWSIKMKGLKDLKGNMLVVGNSVAYTDKNRIKTGKLRSVGARGMCEVEPHGPSSKPKTVSRQAKNLLDISPKMTTITEIKVEYVKGDVVKVANPLSKWFYLGMGIALLDSVLHLVSYLGASL